MLRVFDDLYYPEFMSPCHLVVTNSLPTTPKCFVIAKINNTANIFKYTKEAESINLQEICSNIIQTISKDKFENIFIGSIVQTIFGDIS